MPNTTIPPLSSYSSGQWVFNGTASGSALSSVPMPPTLTNHVYNPAGQTYQSHITGILYGPYTDNMIIKEYSDGSSEIALAHPNVSPAEAMLEEQHAAPTWAYNGSHTTSFKKGSKLMPDDPEQFYNKKITNLLPLSRSKQDGLIGLEIECEGTKLAEDTISYWVTHQDGSLRETDGHPAKEYVLKKPLPLGEVGKALKYLESKLKAAGSSVVKSQRTSVHVHVNVQDLTVRQLYCYVLLYLIFEEILGEWAGPDRGGNLFCLRSKDSEFYVTMLEEALKKSSFRGWSNDFRYSACNICSVPKFGSLEFRSMDGTVDIGRILTWVELLVMLREKSLTYDNPVEIVEEFIQIGPLPFLRKVFDDARFRSLVEHTPSLSGKLWDGLRLMRDIAYSCEWLPPIKKKEGQESQPNLEPSLKELYPDFPWNNGSAIHSPDGILRQGKRWVNDSTVAYPLEMRLDHTTQQTANFIVEPSERVWYWIDNYGVRVFVHKGSLEGIV